MAFDHVVAEGLRLAFGVGRFLVAGVVLDQFVAADCEFVFADKLASASILSWGEPLPPPAAACGQLPPLRRRRRLREGHMRVPPRSWP